MAKLILVPTPLGNLGDITTRALEVFKSADLIYAEDTRTTQHLLNQYNIKGKRLVAYHMNNEHLILFKAISFIKETNISILVTDAGTPGISDPGYMLVRECLKNEIEVEVLPGPVAFIPALVGSGLPCERFFFEGFPPIKKGRQTRFEWLSQLPVTLVMYESPHKIIKTLAELSQFFGADRPACLARELTKIHEEFIRGTLRSIHDDLKSRTSIKGEMVLIVAPAGVKSE